MLREFLQKCVWSVEACGGPTSGNIPLVADNSETHRALTKSQPALLTGGLGEREGELGEREGELREIVVG